ncbi:MAG: heavy-metal-associated domain-containing protein [Ferruginibacter sp.]
MKHFQLTLFACIGFSIFSFAQQKVADKAIIKTPTVQCEQCKSKIENYLAHQYGITSVKVDYKKKATTVTWLTDRTNIEIIKAAIANAGYDADDVTADEGAYKRLPKCCKKTL